jgi:streptogramin lyase
LTETASSIAEQGAAIVGNVHGGQQPVVGAHVYLMQAGTGGLGTASTSLLQSALTGHSDAVGAYVLTGTDGSFSITADYTCTPNSQVYLYALGGNPGYGGNNSLAGFLAVLGNCPTTGTFAATVPYVWVNEVSTVAAAYAFAGYATDATHVGSSNTSLAQTGIANAFATAANLVNTATGVAYTTTPAGNAVVPQTTINTIANILAGCVNTTGSCGTLVAVAQGASGKAPTDTATIAIDIAHYPGYDVGILYSLVPASPAFLPQLTKQPNDFTISLTYTGSGIISKPDGIAVDGSGNVWVANYGISGLTKILASGAFAANTPFTGGGIGPSEAVAIDASGNAWVVNSTKNTLSKFSAAGTAISSSTGYTGGNMNLPDALAIDANGYVWVGNATRNVCINAFNPNTSTFTSNTGYTINGNCTAAYGIAIDASGNVWTVNNDVSTVTEFNGSSSGTFGAYLRGTGNGGIASPVAVAINSSAQVWVADGGRNSTNVSEFNVSNGQALSGPSGVTGGGVNTPFSVAADGAGNVWFANSGGGSLSEFSNTGAALSPAATSSSNGGYVSTSFSSPYGIAIDGSGNIWVADEGANAVIEMIGLATPVVTPLVAGLKTPYTPGSQP